MDSKVINIETKGLKSSEVLELRNRFGKNVFEIERPRRLLHILKDIVAEPMFVLLLVASILYLLLDQVSEGVMLMIAMIFVAGIAVFQDYRSNKALTALKKLSAPTATIIRDGKKISISSEDILPGDLLTVEEGNLVPADGRILSSSDFAVNEAIITGESFPVEKNSTEGRNEIFQGTTVNSGQAYAIVTAIGNNTELGKIGKTIKPFAYSKTMLQKQVNRFVSRLAFFGLTAFVVICFISYLKTGILIQSILFGLTLAMAAIPEEIPVAFSSFMALGAWQMGKLGIISRQPQTIENLGSVDIICLDKTGTITENKMTVVSAYDFENDMLSDMDQSHHASVLGYAMLASESDPFDPMEQAIHDAHHIHQGDVRLQSLKKIYEYPLEGSSPMMTHIYKTNNHNLVAAKGAAERILHICKLDDAVLTKVSNLINSEAEKGYRVIAVASAIHGENTFPARQDDFEWKFVGFLCLNDPPKENIKSILKQFHEAGIKVKMITGDYPATAVTISRQIGLSKNLAYITGEQVLKMNPAQLKAAVSEIDIFARMFPGAKFKVIEALQLNGHIVAMSGDGVNDAPALQSSDIGIAMGKGSEVAQQAADLVITDDNLEKLLIAVTHGRKILSNLRKAIRYIISIHIPIILTASLPILLNWKFAAIYTPIHVIFLELIMGPTCSVFFEREPVEDNIMKQPPRNRNLGLFTRKEVFISVLQGIAITIGVLWIYYSSMYKSGLEETRTMVFTTILFCNIFLTFTNRSDSESIFKTIFYPNKLAPIVFLISVLFVVAIHVLEPLQSVFGLVSVPFSSILYCLGIAFVAVGWFEVYKAVFNRLKK